MKERGCINACICKEHIVSLSYRTDWLMFMKLGRVEVLVGSYKCYCFSARFTQGQIQSGPKMVTRGPLLQRTSSDQKPKATNRIHSNDLQCYVAVCNNYAICNTLQTALNSNAVCNTSYFKLRCEGNAICNVLQIASKFYHLKILKRRKK